MKTLQDYYNFFEAIPTERWCRYFLNAGSSTHCARGHLGSRQTKTSVIESPEALEFYNLTGTTKHDINGINDGISSEFPQPSPKERILAFIKSKL